MLDASVSLRPEYGGQQTCRDVWAAVFTFNPYLLISINELLISIIHLLISINMATSALFIDINK